MDPFVIRLLGENAKLKKRLSDVEHFARDVGYQLSLLQSQQGSSGQNIETRFVNGTNCETFYFNYCNHLPIFTVVDTRTGNFVDNLLLSSYTGSSITLTFPTVSDYQVTIRT